MGLFVIKSYDKLKLKLSVKLVDGIYLPRDTRLELYTNDEYLSIYNFKKSYTENIRYENIINISFDLYNDEIIENKSVVKRAIVAGAVTGGLGSIIGAISGIGTKTKINKLEVVYIEYLDVVDNTKNLLILQPTNKLMLDNFIDLVKYKMNK